MGNCSALVVTDEIPYSDVLKDILDPYNDESDCFEDITIEVNKWLDEDFEKVNGVMLSRINSFFARGIGTLGQIRTKWPSIQNSDGKWLIPKECRKEWRWWNLSTACLMHPRLNDGMIYDGLGLNRCKKENLDLNAPFPPPHIVVMNGGLYRYGESHWWIGGTHHQWDSQFIDLIHSLDKDKWLTRIWCKI